MKSYKELLTFKTLEDRYRYLRIGGQIGIETFGCNRYINQNLYTKDPRWKDVRREVIIRDNGCDLAMPGFEIHGKIIVHHINPITLKDFLNNSPVIFDPDNLICVSFNTHQAIHYGDESLLPSVPIERKPGDTCIWRI